MTSKRIGSTDGLSTTGVSRGLLVESSKTGDVLVTITGVGGKRHASMLLNAAGIDAAMATLITARATLDNQATVN